MKQYNLLVGLLICANTFAQVSDRDALAGAQDLQDAGQYIDPVRGRNLQDLISAAFSRNADLLAARQRLAEAQGLLRQAGLRPNPALEASVDTGAPLGSTGERTFSFGYTHKFELGGKRQRRVEVGTIGLDLAEAEVADRERLLRAGLRASFGQALASARSLGTVQGLQDILQQTYKITSARIKEGEAAPLEGGLLEVELGRLNSEQTIAENQVRRAVLELRQLAALPDDEDLRLRPEATPPAFDLALPAAVEKALSVRPDLRAARIQETLAEAELRQVRAGVVPNLVAFGRYARTNEAFDQFGLNQSGARVPLRDSDNILTAGVSVQLPIRNRSQGLIEAAVARQRAATRRREYLETVVGTEVASAVTRYQAARRALQLFDDQVLDQSRQNLRVIRAAYEAGELRIFDVLNEQRRLIDTQRAYIDVLREYYTALTEVERATGVPLQ